jgi:hypothetical protein
MQVRLADMLGQTDLQPVDIKALLQLGHVVRLTPLYI